MKFTTYVISIICSLFAFVLSATAVSPHYEYSAFGQSRYTESATAFKVSRRYTGQILDDATGLYYYNARYYDPVLGRFIEPDHEIPEFGDPQSYNRYAYCLNDPLRFTDPNGRAPMDWANSWSGQVDAGAADMSAGASHWIWNGTVGTIDSLANGIPDALRFGSSAGAVSGNPNPTAGQIVIAGVQEVGRAATLAPVAGGLVKGAGTLAGTLSKVAEAGSDLGVSASGGIRPTVNPRAGELGGINISGANAAKSVQAMTAAERRAYYISKGVPENQIGPSGYPKVHSVDHPTRKSAEDAAAQGGKGPPMSHPNSPGQSPHFHSADANGNKTLPNVHHNYPN